MKMTKLNSTSTASDSPTNNDERDRYEDATSKMAIPTTTIFCELFNEIAAIQAENETRGIQRDFDDILEELNTTRKKEKNNDPD